MSTGTEAVASLTPDDCIIRRMVLQRGSSEPTFVVTGVNPQKAADMLMQQFTFVHGVETNQTYLYVPKCGCYMSENTDLYIQNQLYEQFRPYRSYDTKKPVMNKSTTGEIISRIHAATGRSIHAFEQTKPFFNVANGTLDLEIGVLMDHSPSFMLLNQSDVIYNPDAQCPKFTAYLNDYVDSKYHNTMAEMFGYSLWPTYLAQKAFMLFGPPRTGKGTLLRVLQTMLCKESYSSVSLHDLITDKYKRAELFGMRANISGDLPDTPIPEADIFRNLTGEDDVTVEFKYGRPFKMTNTAKLIFAANKLPPLKNKSAAFYSRWALIPVEHTFIGREDPKVEAALKTPDELSGILNWALDGLSRLLANNWQFSAYLPGEAVYQRQSEPVIAFLEDECEPCDDDSILKADMVVEYNKWARANGFPPAASMKAFGGAMADQTLIPVDTTTKTVGDKRKEAWAGIRFKTAKTSVLCENR